MGYTGGWVDAMHDAKKMRLLAVWHSRARPSVGGFPWVSLDISSECLNELEERLNSSGLGEEVASTVGVGGISSSGIMWSMGQLAGDVVGGPVILFGAWVWCGCCGGVGNGVTVIIGEFFVVGGEIGGSRSGMRCSGSGDEGRGGGDLAKFSLARSISCWS